MRVPANERFTTASSPRQPGHPPPKIVVITGPTASGKSALALGVAEELGAEIVSADSMQVYRRLDIGTAKPSAAERARVPHHVIDRVEPDELYHAGQFLADADAAVEDIRGRDRVPLVVGGTALYLRVFLHGLAPGPPRDEALRHALEARWDRGESRALHEELRRVDPALASRLHPNDRTRIVRGLEVYGSSGRPLSSIQAEHRFAERRWDALVLACSVARRVLYERIDRRVDEMLAAGWVEEVRRVLDAGFSPDLPPLQAIGYRQIVRHVAEGDPLRVEEIRSETRRFAKRQMTWFRRMAPEWVPPEAAEEVVARVKKFLQTPPPPL